MPVMREKVRETKRILDDESLWSFTPCLSVFLLLCVLPGYYLSRVCKACPVSFWTLILAEATM